MSLRVKTGLKAKGCPTHNLQGTPEESYVVINDKQINKCRNSAPWTEASPSFSGLTIKLFFIFIIGMYWIWSLGLKYWEIDAPIIPHNKLP